MPDIRKDELDFDDKNWRVAFDSDNNVIIQNETVDREFTFHSDGSVTTPPRDVRNISSPSPGQRAYHDPSISGDSNTEGPAYYDGSAWISVVDGSTIS